MKKAFWLIMTGVAIGILIAPEKGSETLKKITDCLDDLQDKARRGMDDLKNSVRDMEKKGKEDAQNLSKDW
jgi:gas vesicle protein